MTTRGANNLLTFTGERLSEKAAWVTPKGFIPIRFQDETKARRIFHRWQDARREHTRSGL